jgi:hypothetical protein
MSEPFCEDCIHFDNRDYGADCNHPDNLMPSRNSELVERDKPLSPSYRWQSAHTMRKAGWLEARLHRMCGREGRWFEPTERSKQVKPWNPFQVEI